MVQMEKMKKEKGDEDIETAAKNNKLQEDSPEP